MLNQAHPTTKCSECNYALTMGHSSIEHAATVTWSNEIDEETGQVPHTKLIQEKFTIG